MIKDIPHIIHQIWLQGSPPVSYLQLCASYEGQQEYGWEYNLWDEETLGNFIDQNYPQYVSVWKDLKKIGQKADFSRYLLMHHYGGIYADMDSQLHVNLDSLFKNTVENVPIIESRKGQFLDEPLGLNQSADIVLSLEGWCSEYIQFHHGPNLHKVNNGIIFSKKNLDFWVKFIEFARNDHNLSVLCSFGVHTFTEYVYRHLLDCWATNRRSRGEEKLMPRILIMPPNYCGPPRKNMRARYITHYFHSNWRPDAGEHIVLNKNKLRNK